MRKWVSMLAAAALCLASLTAPALAQYNPEYDSRSMSYEMMESVIEQNQAPHGPMPIAILGTAFGAVMYAVSVPFSGLIAPLHFADSIDEMVMRPWRATTGAEPPSDSW